MNHRSISRALAAALLAAALVPTPAVGLTVSAPVAPAALGQTTFVPVPLKGVDAQGIAPRKPAVSAHPDTAPQFPGGVAGSIAPTQPAVPEGTVPRADGSGAGVEHELEYATANDKDARSLDGRNNAAFNRFTDGDMIVVFDPSSIAGHTGLFDRRFYTGLSSLAFWSANVSPANGVQRESCAKYRAYDQAYGLWVPSEANHGAQARDFAARQFCKPYSLFASKTDYRSFYCSKLLWAAWHSSSGLDLDGDGGFWVWPVDLINSRYTTTFGVWN